MAETAPLLLPGEGRGRGLGLRQVTGVTHRETDGRQTTGDQAGLGWGQASARPAARPQSRESISQPCGVHGPGGWKLFGCFYRRY